MAIVLETTVGDMTIDLYTKERPLTCKNFLKLCKMKYYNFNLFYSIQSNFIAQTGDPTGTGKGGESVFSFIKGPETRYFTGEKLPRLKHTKAGLVSMVNCGNNLVGSQFFITLKNDLSSLDEHIIFGEVAEGFEVLLKLNETICDLQNRPYKDIRITHTILLDDPFDDIEGLIFPSNSPEPTKEVLESNRIGADEEIDDSANCSISELEELKAEQEAKARATVLEIVGDIPDKDIAPPENVLFVCKLNPLTTDEDLEIIFSRFGKINSCEVIIDKKTGSSLQYAFIEFDNKKSCENAYLKMDNVLIDDRRIHVDFSQSVSKLRWKGKGHGVEFLDEENGTNDDKIRIHKERSNTDKNRYERKNLDKHKSRHNSNNRSRHRSKSRSSHRSRSSSPLRSLKKYRHRSRSEHKSHSRRSYSRNRKQDNYKRGKDYTLKTKKRNNY